MVASTPNFRLALLALGLWSLPALLRADEKIEYNRHIRPVLADACFKCHGPAAHKGGFRLDLREEAIKPAKSGARPIVAGKPEQSEIVKRIFSTDEDEQMPPPGAHKTLKPAQKELLKTWIAQGAVYQKHWSFEQPVKVAPPKVAGLTSSNPIDAFIADRLRHEGLRMSPEADRPTLIRRVAFALTGLPPTPAEVDVFLADTSSDAYEKMVDRYLASKHYGEEMARHWLDLARYADTHGLHFDNERQMWLYRDWVVKSFNNNLPFDLFTIEQLAGDLLPKATSDQLIATGYNRCNVSTNEGGSISEEWVYRNAVDRTTNMMETWLALTGGCAVCHDHKFDPISAKEFYSLYAFFLSADGPVLDGNQLQTAPFLKMSTPVQDKKLAELSQQIAKVQAEIAAKLKALKYADPARAEKADSKVASDPTRSLQAWRKQGGRPVKNLPKEITTLLKKDKLAKAGEDKLRDYYLANVCVETKATFTALNKQSAALMQEREKLDKSVPGTFIFKEMAKPRDSFVMVRGQYNKPGEKVVPNTLVALPPLVKANPQGRATRLDLAHWLLAPEHPLTARVAVNRYWQQFFGTGLVKSSADFGTQGQLPSHPELLDYLALEFISNSSPLPPGEGSGPNSSPLPPGEGLGPNSSPLPPGEGLGPNSSPLPPGEGLGVRVPWDIKAMVRLMVTSATFRQSSRVTPDVYKRDPDNRYYARGPRFRLDAEQIRDNALFVSGLINLEMGGRGSRTYQPPRIWEPVAYSGSNTKDYTQDKGPALYRRSIYMFLKRTAPAPYMANFDAPNRESLCSRRERSNTPLQALQLMNDVQHFEAARKLAERMLVEGGKTPADRIRFAYRIILARFPESQELAIVQETLQHHLDHYQKDVEAAKKAIHVGESPVRAGLAEPELAAYTLIANLLLNLDETVTRN